MKKNYPIIILIIFTALTAACTQSDNSISESDIKIAHSHSLSMVTPEYSSKEKFIKPSAPDFVPEKIAKSLVHQLESGSNDEQELAKVIYLQAALLESNRLGDKSLCIYDYDSGPDEQCFKKHRYGAKSLGQALRAEKIDLNEDGIKDYLIYDRYYIQELSANQAKVYFVMLSKPDGHFQLSFARWASMGLLVVEEEKTGKKILMEQCAVARGTTTKILQLVDGKYVPRTCLFEDENGFSKCSLD